MKGLIVFLTWFKDFWPFILIVIACGIKVYFSLKESGVLGLTTEQKIDIALKAIQETILQRVSIAEMDWDCWKKAGSIKRAQVIAEIYEEHPILKEYVDQERVIKLIDEYIEKALEVMKKSIEEEMIKK